MQRGDEDGALDRELECTVLQQLFEHGGDAEPVPIRPNSKGPPMHLAATDNDPSASSSSVLMSNTWSVSLAPEANNKARAPEAIKSSASPQIGDDGLPYGALDAFVLDYLNIDARAGFFDVEEHGAPETEHHDN